MADLYRPPWRESAGPLRRLVVEPTLRFMQIEAAGGIALVIAALIALIWANIDPGSYYDFWHTPISFDIGIWAFEENGHAVHLVHVVDDVLMVFFFLVVGAEIKREVVHGELRNPRRAALPILAALGGMLIPAGLYALLNIGGPGGPGWGIPVATDIAFALGVLALLGPRIPVQLKVFLLTLAVADDVGGILIIAVFYSEGIRVEWLGGMLGAIAFLLVLRQIGVRHFGAHAIGGVFLWLTLWEAGIHSPLAGVILGLIVPASSLYDTAGTARRVDYFLQRFRHALADEDPRVAEHDSQEALRSIRHVAHEGMSPLERLEEMIAPISAFVVVPIFALANAGIVLSEESIRQAVNSDISSIAFGIFLGLIVGKFVGIVGFSWVAVKFKIALKPPELNWPGIAGAALLAGIGFTVALFIADLSFPIDPTLAGEELAEARALEEVAKMGIFAASIVAAVLGYAVLRFARGHPPAHAEAIVEPEAAPQPAAGD